MYIMQFRKRSEAQNAHFSLTHYKDPRITSHIHWANIVLCKNSLPFIYYTDGNINVDIIKKTLLSKLSYLDRFNIINSSDTFVATYSSDDKFNEREVNEKLKLKKEDIFIPFEQSKAQRFGYVMFPEYPGKTNPQSVCYFIYLFYIYFIYLFIFLFL